VDEAGRKDGLASGPASVRQPTRESSCYGAHNYCPPVDSRASVHDRTVATLARQVRAPLCSLVLAPPDSLEVLLRLLAREEMGVLVAGSSYRRCGPHALVQRGAPGGTAGASA
jgi:hypothetical protein